MEFLLLRNVLCVCVCFVCGLCMRVRALYACVGFVGVRMCFASPTSFVR